MILDERLFGHLGILGTLILDERLFGHQLLSILSIRREILDAATPICRAISAADRPSSCQRNTREQSQ